MSFCRLFLFFVPGAFLTIAPAKAQAPSFDCGKATTEVERLICSSPSLADLDAQLAGAVKKALAASPAQRDSLLAAERNWTRDRDKKCAASGPQTKAEGSDPKSCLAEAYRARISELQSNDANASAETSARGKTEVCRKIADRYRALIKANPQAPYAKSSYAESPLEVLTSAKGSGVTVAEPVAEFHAKVGGLERELFDWAKRLPQPFVLPADILDEIEFGVNLRVDRLPGSNYFAASTIEGRDKVYSGVYFAVEKGRAHLAAAPKGWTGELRGGGTYSFGTFDGAPVAFADDSAGISDFSLTTQLTVTPGA
jgi:uncharacterized protein